MKTAMQELIYELDLAKIVDRNKLIMVKYIINQLLEKEKQQIIDAYSSNEGIWDADTYFNETYKNNL